MSVDRYRITIEPATRLGVFFDRPCLSVSVYDNETWRHIGFEKTRKRDETQAQRLAAKMISDWEQNFSRVSI